MAAVPSLEDLRETLEVVGECARPLTALDPRDLAEQTAAAYAHAWHHATCASVRDTDQTRARTRRQLAARLAGARTALLERTATVADDAPAQHGDDEEGAYRSAAAYAAAAGCVLPPRTPRSARSRRS
ncbi:MAG TPA: hypothetical protein VGO80_06275 [Solirubrobacteraceae bacterium]|jgi:hypothetical protein|nr:hypothetical protein [Solirubrobacteraceae bacterium]